MTVVYRTWSNVVSDQGQICPWHPAPNARPTHNPIVNLTPVAALLESFLSFRYSFSCLSVEGVLEAVGWKKEGVSSRYLSTHSQPFLTLPTFFPTSLTASMWVIPMQTLFWPTHLPVAGFPPTLVKIRIFAWLSRISDEILERWAISHLCWNIVSGLSRDRVSGEIENHSIESFLVSICYLDLDPGFRHYFHGFNL